MEIFSALGVLTLFGITIILGYVGSLIFSRTRIPDVIWLVILGLIVGPLLGLIDRTIFVSMSPLLAAIALMIILFDAGLNMDFYQTLRGFPRSTLLAVLGMFLSMSSVGLISIFLFKFSLIQGLLLGAIIGGTSSPIVISIVSQFKINPKIKTLLNLESIITDPLCVVVAIAFIQLMTFNATSGIAHSIFSAFSIGAVLGLIVGLVWLLALDKLRGKPFDYMLTLAVLFLLYSFIESIAGSGAIGALFFGLVLGNGKIFSKMLKFEKIFKIEPSMKRFHTEISFFIRSFFFVYIGLIVMIKPIFILYGLLITGVLILVRFIAVQLTVIKMEITELEKNVMAIMTPRGLAAAVLAQLPIVFGLAYAETYLNIAFVVILATVIYTTVMTRIFYKPEINENFKKTERIYLY